MGASYSLSLPVGTAAARVNELEEGTVRVSPAAQGQRPQLEEGAVLSSSALARGGVLELARPGREC